ncbi:helix-turn-helix transcriptional regulator [Cytophagaceae bacterium YF14B1]|uniref:Helix-turn-helix transcriptional regulator n=1 Tax=Xanthocytophaga flava TaxID=3048013 RepID=A0AAE3UAA3_9BACT|nr:helix-turn-helix transcriptional regulator [Xanthocytophaga flavus]MDJ1482584.1 helix-turn-helix transcriptional regulator [Xanthocytophaga flavus]
MKTASLTELYEEITTCTHTDLTALLPSGIQQQVGHFNLFDINNLFKNIQQTPASPYACRSFYKISLTIGASQVIYPNKVFDIKQAALIFSTPKMPFYWHPFDMNLSGKFCVFTPDFLQPLKSGVVLDELPIFNENEYPVFVLSDEQCIHVMAIFQRMQEELKSDYAYKYDLLRTYVLELIHFGQKLQPATTLHPTHSASARITSLFIELLEQQFPIETPQQQVRLRTAKEYADVLAVHVNHLNKILKQETGRTTTDLISERIAQEAQVLLKKTHWTMAEISDSLGFTDVSHFSHFFKRQTLLSPAAFRTEGNYQKVLI